MRCAMGTICAPAYANIFMAQFEDDLNKKRKTIKFDYKISTKQTEFLNTMVYRDQQHKIQTTIFRKPTEQQTYLHAQSNRPKSLKDSIPYSQARRIKAICSATSEFNKNCDIIRKRFKERDYRLSREFRK